MEEVMAKAEKEAENRLVEIGTLPKENPRVKNPWKYFLLRLNPKPGRWLEGKRSGDDERAIIRKN